ncbi:MAG: OsmC family protein [Blastocatellia bacterium]
MSSLSVKVSWAGDLRFVGVNTRGHETILDGNIVAGASPVEALIEAVGACSAIDVVAILEKVRTPATRLEVTLEGDRHTPEPRYLTSITLRFDVWGDGISPDKLERAINLSIGKYCSVYHSLRPDMKLQTVYRIHPAAAEAAGDYHPFEITRVETA